MLFVLPVRRRQYDTGPVTEGMFVSSRQGSVGTMLSPGGPSSVSASPAAGTLQRKGTGLVGDKGARSDMPPRGAKVSGHVPVSLLLLVVVVVMVVVVVAVVGVFLCEHVVVIRSKKGG